MPEPFVGNTDSPIILLVLNPGVSDEDFVIHQQPDFRAQVRMCLRQEIVEYPNYYLSPNISCPGARWMRRVLRPLLTEIEPSIVARNVMQLESFPYHSRKFAHHQIRVPSQGFTYDLLRAGIRREAIIFITRGRRIWQEAVPELSGYGRAFTTRSVQNVVISPRNCPDGYGAAREVLRRAI